MNIQRAASFILLFFLLLPLQVLFCQNQRLADSLAWIYKTQKLKDTAKLELLRNLAFNEVNDLNLALKYSDELIQLSIQLNNNLYLHRGYFQRGNKKRLLGALGEALESYFKSADAASKAEFIPGLGSAYGAIADIYVMSDNFENAILFYDKSISTLRQSNDSIRLASAISNAGEAYRKHEDFQSALKYYQEAEEIFDKVNYQIGKAYCLGNIGMVNAKLGDNAAAENNINSAVLILRDLEDYYPICEYYISMSDIYLKKGNHIKALNYAFQSLNFAKQYGLKEQISNAHLKLSDIYKNLGRADEALSYYKEYTTYKDSINNLKDFQKMADLRMKYEVAQKQREVDLLNQEKKYQRNIVTSLIVILILTTVLLVTMFWYYKAIAREKNRSDSLLLNILPAETAQELKQYGRVGAEKFESVTVLFTDFVQFSKLAEYIDPELLVKSVDSYFKKFDEITTQHGLEKIKTIGDSYMCASGLPAGNNAHARNAIQAAIEMLNYVQDEMKSTNDLCHFEIRIGIHTGPVVAGIVGLKKWQYDIWGDTVNIASRMESASTPGRINVSETTYNEVKDEFTFEYRGEIQVKNRGLLKMYYLT